MAQNLIESPFIPGDATIIGSQGQSIQLQNLGQSAQERLAIRERKITELELRGEIEPATILNRSPFPVRVESGIMTEVIPPREWPGKAFSSETFRMVKGYPIYKGNQEMSDKSIRPKYDWMPVLPARQVMEYKRWYLGETGDDKLLMPGGIVVFMGEVEGIKPNMTVRTPEFVFRKGNRYMRMVDRVLKDLIDESDEQMYNNYKMVLEEAGHDADDPMKRKNIQHRQHVIADFMLGMKQIQNAPHWRNVQFKAEDCCPRCNAQYVSKTGMCKCSYVVDPLLAFMSGEIEFDHVRMNTLTGEQFKKAKAEQSRREEARK